MKRYMKKAIVILMCAALIMSSSACNIAEQIRNSVHERITIQEDVSIQEMTRLLISSINDKRTTADTYSRIPESQLDGLSYSYFYEYMNILRSVSTQDSNGKVVSFRILGDQECRDLLVEDVSNTYGNIRGAQLLYSTDVQYPVYIFFSEDADGKISLSRDWVTSIINIYNYSNHYFTLLDENNADGVKALLIPGLQSDVYTDEVLYAKAQQLCDFYRLRVMSSMNEYEITRLFPWEMTVRIPETIAVDGELFEEHEVYFSYEDGSYAIDDQISIAPDVSLVYLVRGDERLVRVGNEYSNEQLSAMLGDYSTATYDPTAHMMILIYPDLILRVDEVSGNEESWTGTVTSIRLIRSSVYSIGYNLFVGMTRSQILLAYPNVDNLDFTLPVEGSSGTYNVTFTFDDDDIVTYIKVSA